MSMSIVGTEAVRIPVFVASLYLFSQVLMILLVASISCQPGNRRCFAVHWQRPVAGRSRRLRHAVARPNCIQAGSCSGISSKSSTTLRFLKKGPHPPPISDAAQ